MNKEFLDRIREYVESRSFPSHNSPGLLQPRFNYSFSLVVLVKNSGENEITTSLYDESLAKIADSIRAILFISYDSEDFKQLNRSQRRILNNLKKTLNSEKSELNYLGIYNSQIIPDLVERAIGMYKERFPNLVKHKERIIDYIES